MKLAILDDYQGVALKSADWDRLNLEKTVFTKPSIQSMMRHAGSRPSTSCA